MLNVEVASVAHYFHYFHQGYKKKNPSRLKNQVIDLTNVTVEKGFQRLYEER